MVSGFKKKVETLKDKRDGVLLDVDAAKKNGKNIYPKVNSWLPKADKMIDSELKEVKCLEEETNNKCFFGLCPNFKACYQLSKKAKEDVNVVDELLQQGEFDKVSYQDVLLPIVVVPLKDFEDFDSRKLIFNKSWRRPDVQKIQDQITDMLGLKFEEQSVTRRASRLCQRLKKEKNILVVLDEIWAKLDLMELGIPLRDEDQRCTILLTSRDLNVLLKDIDAKKSFSIGVLEYEEAWHFFNKIIGDGVESSDLLPIATKVAKNCLPIAVRTLASSLRYEPPYVWEDALRQLSKPLFRTFTGGLGLFHGISTIKETMDKLLTVVRHLKASCLLHDGNTSMQFDIHDLISDVAKSTSKGNLVFVLRNERDLNDWPNDETVKECHKIVCSGISDLLDKLKCPKLTFLGSLGALCLINCVLGYITLIGELKNPEIVIITSSDIEVLAKEIGQLTKIKQLDLRGQKGKGERSKSIVEKGVLRRYRGEKKSVTDKELMEAFNQMDPHKAPSINGLLVNALESSFGWQIGDGMKARFGFDRCGFEGLDGNSLKAHFNGNRDGLVSELWMPNSCEWDRGRRVGHDLLPTNVKVASIFHGSSRGCIQCGMEEQSTIHALRDWLKTYVVLSLGGLDGRLLGNDYVRCIDWLEDVTCLLDLKAYENLITILWNVWNSRNNAMFQGKEEDTRIVWERAISLGDDFRIFDLTNAPLIPKTPSPQKQNKSPSSFFKINVDVAIVDDLVGLGVIAWDYDGN
ncbi:hypothetical protein Goshw_015974 [Gossypium schwendimanii]|uniref:NB-ARC domain-containing protein n=1 Tax=Gossypium schwendimanii TaxID=34291 RepID=A0A7J9N4W8_GOSSC|nr:hypothetical protein [Gossypium schwendimanii]